MSDKAYSICSEPVFDPETLASYWPDGSVFEGYPCLDCSRPVHDWAAGEDEWATVMGDWDAGHLCVDCFMIRAHAKGLHLHVVRYCEDGET